MGIFGKPTMSEWAARCNVCQSRPCVTLVWHEGKKYQVLCGTHLVTHAPLIAGGLDLPVVSNDGVTQ